MNRLKPACRVLGVLTLSGMCLDASAIGIVNGQATAFLTIDGERMNLAVEPVNGTFVIPEGTVIGSEQLGAQIIFTEGVTMDPDPSIAYGFAVIDFGAPSVFGFTFATPIVPTGPGTLVASTIAGGLTDFTDDGIALTPTGADVQTSDVSTGGLGGPYTNMGVDIGPAFADAGGGTGLPVPYVYGPYVEGLIAGPGGTFDALRVSLTFSLSGGGDVAALTGSASIIEAPVPDGGAGFAGVAAIGTLLAFAGRRRR